MTDVINLRTIRKRAEREREAARAQERRAAFGQTKAERRKAQAEAEIAQRSLDGHHLGAPDQSSPGTVSARGDE
jgi:Domain of unknown function (DUF4169)